MDNTRKKRELPIPPIRPSGRRGELNQFDAAVIIGNSKQSVVLNEKTGEITPLSDVQASKGRTSASKGRISASKGRTSASKGKPKRSRRIYFIPNKVSMTKLKAWKKQYGAKFYLSMISLAIEKYEP
ncbi:MAG TPA: hypothetical protein PJ987_13325 [Bacteroidia bacterium]|nr:hypothetical protein [Bacteroidia bacterium]